MRPIAPVPFAGNFQNLRVYSLGFDAVPVEGGISSEDLISLQAKIENDYPGVRAECNPYNSYTALVTSGDAEQLELADTFVRRQLDAKGVQYNERPADE